MSLQDHRYLLHMICHSNPKQDKSCVSLAASALAVWGNSSREFGYSLAYIAFEQVEQQKQPTWECQTGGMATGNQKMSRMATCIDGSIEKRLSVTNQMSLWCILHSYLCDSSVYNYYVAHRWWRYKSIVLLYGWEGLQYDEGGVFSVSWLDRKLLHEYCCGSHEPSQWG